MKPVRVLIVDDEPPARRKIRVFLEGDFRFEVAGEAGDGEEAVLAIGELSPQLVFLDIQMPGLTGFEVIETVGVHNFPEIVFTTAYDRYALKAFEVHAVDYLLKPFDADRFQAALERVIQRMEQAPGIDDRIRDLLEQVRPAQKQQYLVRLMVKSGRRMTLISMSRVVRIRSEEKYVRLFIGKDSYLHRETMNNMITRLDPKRFARIHRTEIINLDEVSELEPWSHGDYIIIMKDGSKCNLSRSYRDDFFEKLEHRP